MSPAVSPPRTPRVLVVADEIDRKRLLAMISSDHYEAIWVGTVSEALIKVEQEPIDLVISELYMPDISGWALLEVIKVEHPHVHVVLMTGSLSPEAEDVLTDLKADGFLLKPVNQRRLQILLRALLTTDGLDRAIDVIAVDPGPPESAFRRANSG